MTPEQLEEIQGIGPRGVEKIFECVNAYYAQFEQPAEADGGQLAVEDQRRASRSGARRRSRSGCAGGSGARHRGRNERCARSGGRHRS